MSSGLNVVVLGLSLSSSWGNGHATTYRALLKALAARGHKALFLERDKPWYAAQRDLEQPPFCELRLYQGLACLEAWRDRIAGADAVILGSYVPEGVAVARFVQTSARGITAFYDIDTPVTLAKLDAGDEEYMSAALIPGFDLYLSFTGGSILRRLEGEYGARSARALYCSVDPELYGPTGEDSRWDLGYLGTCSPDRQPALQRLLIEPARRRPDLRFVVAGPQYPADMDWPANVERIEHLPPSEHASFYSSLRWTLNITRADMVAAGYSPSVRLFEAGACCVPIMSDSWRGLDSILRIGREVSVVRSAADVLDRLTWDEQRRTALAGAARRRVLTEHTAAHRAGELEAYIREARARRLGRKALGVATVAA
jgi:spore maturation protein CgeB